MEPSYKSGGESSPLVDVHEGMVVSDREGEQVGKVEKVYLGSVSPDKAARGAGPAEVDEPDMAREGLWDSFEEVFDPVDNLAEDVRERLWRHGFIRIDAPGLMAEDRYVLPDQIAGVSTDEVRLNVLKDELVRR